MIVFSILIGIIGLIAIPLIIIWALNTLFPLNIPYKFQSWLAVIILMCVLLGKVPHPFFHSFYYW
ncbi:MAG: hypothetical protein AAGA27_05750 [Pseudomonadota bacterium]